MENRKKLRLLVILVAVLALTACAKDPIEIGSVNLNKLQIAFTIPDQVPGSYASVGALPSEREFDEAYVIFYDASGQYVAHASSNMQSSTSVGSFEVVKPAAVELDKQYKMLVVANLKHYLDPKYASTSDYIDDKKVLKYDVMQKEVRAVSNNRISRNLPMYAQTDVMLSTPSVISVVFERAVARIDLVSVETDLDIEWVKVCNYNNAGYLYHNEYNASGSAIINGGGAGDVESTPKKVNLIRRPVMDDPMAAQSNTNGGLYAFSNINVNTGVNDQKTTCLLFKGTYSYTDKSGKPQTKEGYYRVNVCMPGKPQSLKRNNVYRITVKSVSDGGADNEDEAMRNPTVNVNYEINDWAVDNSQEVITDANGNYLVVSPTSAYIGGGKGSTLKGGIKVKNGSSWTIEKLVAGDTWFSVEKTADNTGFLLTALVDNTTSGSRTSKVRVKVAGTTLQYDIFVYQYSKNISEDAVLIIDGRMGNFTLDVNGNGQTHKLQAILGASSANATMTYVSGDNTMIQASNPTIGLPNAIGNNSTLNLVFRANPSTKVRTSVYKIVRKNSGNTDISLNITFSQPIATQILIPSPSTIFTENSVDGFMNLIGAANITRCQSQRVYVSTLNTITYPKWKATSTFSTYDVALITKPTTTTETYPDAAELKNVATGSSDEYFDIAVSRCGPGDESLAGTITIEGCNAAGTVVANGPKYTIPLTVYSSLNSGFTQIGTLLYHDRNIGAPESTIGDESKITIPALPFSNYTGDYQSADKTGAYRNKSFKGTYHTFDESNFDSNSLPASPLCPPGWRMPKEAEFTALAKVMQWAKAGNRPYIVANSGVNKDKKGCYFPLSGYGDEDSIPVGYYWTSTMTSQYIFLVADQTGVSITGGGFSTYPYPIRCVK